MRCVTASWNDVVIVMIRWTTDPVHHHPLVEIDKFPSSLREGADLRLECQVSNGDATVSIEWMHQNTTLTSSDRVNIADVRRTASKSEERSILFIRNVTVDDEGFYTCKATVLGSAEGVHESHTRKIIIEKVVAKARKAIRVTSAEGDHIRVTSGQTLIISARHEDLSDCGNLRHGWYFTKGSNSQKTELADQKKRLETETTILRRKLEASETRLDAALEQLKAMEAKVLILSQNSASATERGRRWTARKATSDWRPVMQLRQRQSRR